MNKYIINFFLQLAKANEKVRLYNTYKGVPISFDAEFMRISHGVVTLKVHKYQALSIKQSKHTLLRHDVFPSTIHADLAQIDFKELLVSLHNFTYMENSAGNRKCMRVEPEKNFPIVITSGIVVNADAIDISEEGLGVYIKNSLFDAKSFEPDKIVTIEFRNPLEKRLIIKISGVITHILPLPNQEKHRIGIHTFMGENTKDSIQEFISIRQKAILNELENLYRLLMKNISVEKTPYPHDDA